MGNRKITKVVIPVAGMGTRFLPATKVVPKELFPIVSKPIIQLIVEECIAGGIETVVFITARPKILIEDYFDPRDLTSFRLAEAGKESLIESALEISKKVDFVSIRQYQPLGLGHAIQQAHHVVSGQPFAVVLGDDILISDSGSAIGDCIKEFEKIDKGSVIGTSLVSKEETPLYGIVDIKGDADKKDFLPIHGFVEKPDAHKAPSNWAMPGRYVFEKEIIHFLQNQKPGKNGELQLTDAMQNMLSSGHPFFARKITGKRYDTGNKLGFIKANVEMGLRDPSIKESLRAWLEQSFQK